MKLYVYRAAEPRVFSIALNRYNEPVRTIIGIVAVIGGRAFSLKWRKPRG